MLGSFDDSRREKKICHEFNPLVQFVQFVQYVCSMGVKSAHEAGFGDSFIFLERESAISGSLRSTFLAGWLTGRGELLVPFILQQIPSGRDIRLATAMVKMRGKQ